MIVSCTEWEEGNAINKQNHDQKRRAILKQVNTLAWLLDNSIPLPIIHYRIGLDALIGLVPGFGDIAGAMISSFIVLQAIRLGVPRATLVRMVANIAIEASVGMIPLVGDFFDATFKANALNVALLNAAVEDAEAGRSQRKMADQGFVAAVIGALIGLIVLISAGGIAVFTWVVSLFR